MRFFFQAHVTGFGSKNVIGVAQICARSSSDLNISSFTAANSHAVAPLSIIGFCHGTNKTY
jgi:hypothetical protein